MPARRRLARRHGRRRTPRPGLTSTALGAHASRRPHPDDHAQHRYPEIALAYAEIIRIGLAADTDREALDAMVGTLADLFGYEGIIVGRVEHDRIRVLASSGFPEDELARDASVERGEGMAWAAAASERPIILEDNRTDPRYVDVSGGRMASSVIVPMRLADRVWGTLNVESSQLGAFGPADVALLVPLADQMAAAFETVRLRQEAVARAEREQAMRRQMEAIAAIITAGLKTTDIEAALDDMVRGVNDLMAWGAVAVLLREDHGTLRVVSQYGYTTDVVSMRFHESSGILGHVTRTGRPHLAADVLVDPYYDAVVTDTRSEMCAPLLVGGVVRGLLNVESPIVDDFTSDDLEGLARLAAQMALVLHNLELLRAEQDTVARLLELDRMKSDFLAISSHELRTPLTSILGFVELLAARDDELDAPMRGQFLRVVERQTRLLARLVDDILVATSIDRGELEVSATDIDLLTVVQDVIRGRESRVVVSPVIAEVSVVADPIRLQQVLSNLVDNAVKYADGDAISIDVTRDVGVARISVTDRGPGIPALDAERVFERFHQVGEHGVTGRRGVGLGLAIARELTELMGGTIELTPNEPTGCVFTVTLPEAS